MFTQKISYEEFYKVIYKFLIYHKDQREAYSMRCKASAGARRWVYISGMNIRYNE